MKSSDRLLQPERLDNIRLILKDRKTVKVSELSQICGVSENTIRRDLIDFEEMGYCYRTKGCATLIERGHDRSPFSNRLDVHRESKRDIARKAAKLVHNGSTIILDSGTTAVELAEELAVMEHITVITPSLAVADVLAGIPEIMLILPGGIVNQFSRSLTGQPAEQFFSSIHADIFFLAVKAISIEAGLSEHTLAESAVKQQMIEAADKVVVLADHSKLGKAALSKICSIEVISTVITDEKADPDFISNLVAAGISVIT